MNRVVACAALAIAALSAGCFTPKSFVDPRYHKATYADIQRPAKPVPVRVEVHFMRNGAPLPAADGELRGHVERSLMATGVFVVSTDSNVAVISFTGNNIADIGAARAKGFGTGATFGAAGSTVDDNYEYNCVYRDPSGASKSATYLHALHTIVGRGKPPDGMTSTTPAAAFGTTVEDAVLNCTKDLQEAGLVPRQ